MKKLPEIGATYQFLSTKTHYRVEGWNQKKGEVKVLKLEDGKHRRVYWTTEGWLTVSKWLEKLDGD